MDAAGWMDTLLNDIRSSARQLGRHRVFTLVAVLSLAIGIGANTAIFSIMNVVLLKSLPVRNPHELVLLTDPNQSGVSNGMTNGERGMRTYGGFAQMGDHATSCSGMCAAQATLNRWPVRIGGGGQEEARAKLVSEEYFSVLGVESAIGRFFTVADGTSPGQDPYVVLSYDYWQKRFGGNVSALGTHITAQSTPLTVIGVATRAFHG